MTPDRWQQIEAVYASALRRAPDVRAAYLDRACAHDPDLREEVESLLAADEVKADFMERPLVRRSALEPLAEENESDAADVLERVGPYRLIRPLGRGGMGQVYLAVRDEEDFTQHVAVKVLRRGLDTDDILRRFRAERQILARLNHPNIAHLYDGGATDDGRPYFVMEYVDGTPITTYCDRHHLSFDARLRLFRRVCDAVQYAHRNLVVHRDLKPSNILVTEEGQVKLLDFGIAKLLDPTQWEGTIPRTRSEVRVLTPEYAAPEQVKGEAVTTATDVYALGVLLYELLVGQRPYRIEQRVQDEIERVVCEERPQRPSTALRRLENAPAGTDDPPADRVTVVRSTRTEQLRRRLRGDLDTIIMMALRKEPARRYATVEQLAEDVDRHLTGLPVRARPSSLRYRVSKFVRRHRVGVSAGTAIFLLLVAFSTVTAIQARRIQTQSEQVARERDRAEAVTGFLVDLFETSDPREAQGETTTARELLDRGASRIDTELNDQPALRAEMMTVLAEVHESLGRYDRAEALLREALTLQQQVYGDAHAAVASSMDQLALLREMQGDYEAARSLLEEALAVQRTLLGPEHADVATTLMHLAGVRMELGELAPAESLYRDALAMQQRLLDADDPDRARTMNDLAELLRMRGEYAESEDLYRDALDVLEAAYGRRHPDVAIGLNNLAALLAEMGRTSDAEPLYRESLAIRRALLDEGHPDLGYALNNLGSLLRKNGTPEEAEPLFREALAIFETAFGADHPNVAVTRNNLASALRDQGQLGAAEAQFRQAVASLRAALGDDHPNVAILATNLAEVVHRRGRVDEAEQRFRTALETLRATLSDNHPRTARAMVGLGQVLLDRGVVDEAEALLREAASVQQRAFGADDVRTARAQAALGRALVDRGAYAEAESLLVRSHSILRDRQGPDHRANREVEAALARLNGARDEDNRARP